MTTELGPVPKPDVALLAQSCMIPGTYGTLVQHGSGADPTDLLLTSVQTAHRRLLDVAQKEGRRLREPVMVSVIVEAYTEPQ